MIQTDLEEHLRAQEHELATAQQRGDVAAVEALLADDFREIGSLGRLYMKPEVLEVMQQVEILGYSLQDFKFLPLGPGCVIVIYIARIHRTFQGEESTSRSYRSSTWVQQGDRWRVLFHQATPLKP